MLKKFGMRQTTATVLGVLGSIFGLEVAFFLLFFGRLGSASAMKEAFMIASLGRATLYLSVIGFIGGILVRQKPKVAGILMIIGGMGGFIVVSMGYIAAGSLLIIAGILTLLKKPK